MAFILPMRSLRLVLVLAATQIIGWGTTFESLGVMGRIIAPDLGLPNEIVFAGISIMMVISALAGPLTGRLLDRHGAARVLATASALFAIGLTLLAAAQGIVLYIVAWVILGVGGAFGLFAPANAAIVEREGGAGKRTITILLLFTGLSATIFWPLLSLMNGMIGWRMTFLVCAAMQLFICLPLHLFALPKAASRRIENDVVEAAPLSLSPEDGRRAFLLIAAATTIASAISFGISPSLIELLHKSGASPELALQLAAARGVIAISARGADLALGRRSNPLLITILGLGLMLLGFSALLFLPSSFGTLAVFMLFYGLGAGILVVARAILPLAFFSPREYGLLAARLSTPQNLANAISPVIFAAILDRAGHHTAIFVTIALALSGLAATLMLVRLVRKVRQI